MTPLGISTQIFFQSGHLALVQISGLFFRYSLDQQTFSHECQSDTILAILTSAQSWMSSCFGLNWETLILLWYSIVNHHISNQHWLKWLKCEIYWTDYHGNCEKDSMLDYAIATIMCHAEMMIAQNTLLEG